MPFTFTVSVSFPEIYDIKESAILEERCLYSEKLNIIQYDYLLAVA